MKIHMAWAHRCVSFAVLIAVFGLGGCGVTESVTLVNVDVTAPAAVPPVRITCDAQPNRFTITPHLALPFTHTVTGILELSESETYRASAPADNNLKWRIPKMEGGVDVDYVVSHHAALGFGMSISSLYGRTYGGWSAGIGIFNEKETQAVRFDFGVQSTPNHYSSLTRVVVKQTNDSRDTSLYLDSDRDNHLNLFGSLTVNTTRQSWPVNFFVNAYVTKQRFVDYVPETSLGPFYFTNDRRATASQWIVGFTPGVFVQLMEDVRFVAGERIILPFDIVNQDPYPLLQFHMQLDITM